MYQRRFVGIFIILGLLAGCGGDLTPTPVATSPAPTKRIEAILTDTAPPNGVVIGAIKTADTFLGIENVGITQQAEQPWGGTDIYGGAVIHVYETTRAAQTQFIQLETGIMANSSISDLGEKAVSSDFGASLKIVFLRCNVIANVRASGIDRPILITYSRELDAAIKQSFCP